MCGRYVRRADKQRIAEAFHISPNHRLPVFGPSFNVAPQTFQPVVRRNLETGEREIILMRWGLVPYWSKEPKASFSTINAKAETITTAPAFREAMRKCRCLVPADAFYEWQKLNEKTKQPFAIALKSGEPFAFAGLWERWKPKNGGEPLETFTIITTDPNEVMQPLHTRMPVILQPKDYERWLDTSDPTTPLPLDLLRPFPAEFIKSWPIKNDVGNARNDRLDLLDPAIRKS